MGTQFEKAVLFLSGHLPSAKLHIKKPVLFHDIRVGVYLYENGYTQDLVLAGLLHDAIEWFDVNEETLINEFGEDIARLVTANTKDDSIIDKEEKTNELITRCVQNGQNALIVKATDILDSFKWYFKQNNQDELQYCMRNARAIFTHKPDDFDDKIFVELKKWHSTFSDATNI